MWNHIRGECVTDECPDHPAFFDKDIKEKEILDRQEQEDLEEMFIDHFFDRMEESE